MVGPGFFETVRQQFDGRRPLAVPYEKTGRRGTKSTHHPKNIFHYVAPSLCSDADLSGLSGLRCTSPVGCGKVLERCWWRIEAFAGEAGTATLQGMDSVRFGRALGIGARLAAKTVVSAVDAATSPNPSAGAKTKQGAGATPASTAASASTAAPSNRGASGVRMAQQAARTTAQMRQTGRGLKEGGKRFGEAVWGPFVKLSGALWLELTGVFFGIFAVFASVNAWKMRGALHGTAGSGDAYSRLLIAVAMAAVFGYFCVSSFVKANRRTRGR
jgi:hypothetical protein